MQYNDGVKVMDEVKIDHTVGGGNLAFTKVNVLAEDGIFKNGVHYDKGDEAVITAHAAALFDRDGAVKIIEPADIPESLQEELDNAKNT